ncbi:MAG: ABC-2 type transport system ATP-binding protein [Bradymonadia bacterium]|jgi:ABC-2 type transport system ATP-binding protein
MSADSRELLLDVDGLEKVYEGAGWLSWASSLGRLRREPTDALCGLSIKIYAGEIVGLLGPNGSGKSTLLRCIAGLLTPSGGRLRVLGENPASFFTTVRGQVGIVVRDDRSFNQRLSGRDNLRFFARLQGLPDSEIDGRIDELLKRLALRSVGDRAYRYYSSGMKQRLSVARALLGRPRLLLMDEATSGLDPGKRDVFYAVLEELVEKEGIGVLFATHELSEAQYVCHRVVVLDAGMMIASGRYLEVEAAAEQLFRRERMEADEDVA